MFNIRFNAAQVKEALPLLKECYGFDLDEIATELSYIISLQTINNCLDNDLLAKYEDSKGRVDSVQYAINTKEDFFVPAMDNMEKAEIELRTLFETNELLNRPQSTALLLMAAIFSREDNGIIINEEAKIMEEEHLRNSMFIRPDLLKLFIALNEPKHSKPMKICYKNQSPVEIANTDNWFSNMLGDYLKQKLGNITVEEARDELKTSYAEEKGRKSENPYLNYIIHGTYNLIKTFIPSEKVSVEQCKFLKQYLEIIGQIKPKDKISEINTLQSAVKSLISSKRTPVQKHIDRKTRKGLPLFQKTILY